MTELIVRKPGMFTTIQDLGRNGYQRYGVVRGGAMDTVSLRIANLLVGNNESAAGLEMTVTGPVLEFNEEAYIAVCGADLSPTIEGRPVPMWRPVRVYAGAVLQFGSVRFGCRAYLSIAGGIDVPVVMGSCSTYVRAGIGGHHGRSLQAGDRLANKKVETANHLDRLSTGFDTVPWFVSSPEHCNDHDETVIRVMPGPEYEFFRMESRESFFEQSFFVTPQSDRMGYRLNGSPCELSEPLELVSDGIAVGTIQIPPNGQPIVLMADCQTTGGYPRLGVVATVDLPRMAQRKPGDHVRFRKITIDEAQRLLKEREHQLRLLSCFLHVQ